MTAAANPLPLIKLWGTLLVPLQGEVTDDLAERIHSEVLKIVYDSEIESVIIDITGLWLLDSHICAMLAGLGASSKLMGARTVICGMSAEIAQTLQMMDIGLDSVESALNVEEAFQRIGITVAKTGTNEKSAKAKPTKPSSDESPEPLEER